MSDINKLEKWAKQNDINPIALETLASQIKKRYIDKSDKEKRDENLKYVGRCFIVSNEHDGKPEYVKVINPCSDTYGWVTGLSFGDNVKVSTVGSSMWGFWYSMDTIVTDAYPPKVLDNGTEITEEEYTQKMHEFVNKLLNANWRSQRG